MHSTSRHPLVVPPHALLPYSATSRHTTRKFPHWASVAWKLTSASNFVLAPKLFIRLPLRHSRDGGTYSLRWIPRDDPGARDGVIQMPDQSFPKASALEQRRRHARPLAHTAVNHAGTGGNGRAVASPALHALVSVTASVA